MYLFRCLLAASCLIISCNIAAESRTVQNDRQACNDNSAIYRKLDTIEKTLLTRIDSLKRQISFLETKIDLMENRIHAGTHQPQEEVKTWACFLSPTFEDQEFMATSLNKSAAVFDVVAQCKKAGISEFHCDASRVTCSNR